jgi:hypothetical protein
MDPPAPAPLQPPPPADVNPILLAVLAFCVAVALCGAIVAVVLSR